MELLKIIGEEADSEEDADGEIAMASPTKQLSIAGSANEVCEDCYQEGHTAGSDACPYSAAADANVAEAALS